MLNIIEYKRKNVPLEVKICYRVVHEHFYRPQSYRKNVELCCFDSSVLEWNDMGPPPHSPAQTRPDYASSYNTKCYLNRPTTYTHPSLHLLSIHVVLNCRETVWLDTSHRWRKSLKQCGFRIIKGSQTKTSRSCDLPVRSHWLIHCGGFFPNNNLQ